MSIMILAYISITNMRTISLETALIMAEHKVRGDIASFQNRLENEYGVLSLSGGTLVDQRSQTLNGRYDLVDAISGELGIVATIFVKEGNDYKRI